MSSMRRSIRRSIAKANGTFEAQKPLRDRSQKSKFTVLSQMLAARPGNSILSAIKNKMDAMKRLFS